MRFKSKNFFDFYYRSPRMDHGKLLFQSMNTTILNINNRQLFYNQLEIVQYIRSFRAIEHYISLERVPIVTLDCHSISIRDRKHIGFDRVFFPKSLFIPDRVLSYHVSTRDSLVKNVHKLWGTMLHIKSKKFHSIIIIFRPFSRKKVNSLVEKHL